MSNHIPPSAADPHPGGEGFHNNESVVSTQGMFSDEQPHPPRARGGPLVLAASPRGFMDIHHGEQTLFDIRVSNHIIRPAANYIRPTYPPHTSAPYAPNARAFGVEARQLLTWAPLQ